MVGFLTVITKSHLSYAQVLMSRIKETSSNSRRFIFVVDIDSGEKPDLLETAEILSCEEFLSDGLDRFLNFKYTAFELSNAARPYAQRYLRDRTECDQWIYLDSDIYPTGDITSLLDEYKSSEILFSPHRLSSNNKVYGFQGDYALLKSGTFNSGFLGIRRGSHSSAFIDWFMNCANERCYGEFEHCYGDQIWFNLAYIYFDSSVAVKHPGANIGYWNIDERPVEYNSNGVLMVNEFPVLFLHFSGWDPEHSEIMSCYFSDESVPKPWFDYATKYSQALKEAQEVYPRNIPYRWNTYEDGTPVLLKERRNFAGMVEKGEWPEGLNPFAANHILKDRKPDRMERIFGRIRKIPQKLFSLFR